MASHRNSPPLTIITQLLSISFFLLLHSPSPATAVPATNNDAPSSLVNKVCQKTTLCSYNDCVAALALDPKSSSATDAKALAKIALKLAVSNSTSSEKYIDEMAKNEGSSPGLKSALEYCVLQYQSVVLLSFRSALNEVDDDPLTANYDAKFASDGAYYCGEKLKSGGFQSHDVDSIRTRNNYVTIYSDIGFAVTNMIS
ncbi:uncharacterized protein LOC116146458 [Pistacia vera]|uniref:Uncharacterized protein n=1 Tax=Pistacia atlantica TaxID=434234 RepID=A0ACC1AJB3_9ROSI|nr:uncharacterized protein LOC116146458 [Pistacia vera]KAJ0086761.1 hypothetical protein Patl1_08013 [Pistacia atlantica]